jgi:hypothetical protein
MGEPAAHAHRQTPAKADGARRTRDMKGEAVMRARVVLFVLLVLVVLVVFARPSSAQGTPRVGLTMAVPGAVGLIWHATDALAIRPDLTFSQSASDSGASLTTSSTSVGVGVSALFYVRTWDNLRAYLSPRFGYKRSSVTYAGSSPLSPSSDAYSGSGAVGAEYLLHRRFAVFAETGFAYTHSDFTGTTSSPGLSLDSSSHTWGTRAGVGAILYF